MKKCFLCLFFAVFIFAGCGKKSPYEGESLNFPTEIEDDSDLSSAIPMAWLIITNAIGEDVDFSYRHVTASHLSDYAYKVAGRCFYDDSEHLYEIRIHFKGGERTSLKDWEYSTLSVSNTERTETEHHSTGTWDGDY